MQEILDCVIEEKDSVLKRKCFYNFLDEMSSIVISA